MKELLVRVLTAALLCGLLEMLTPVGEREGLRRAVRLLCSLFLLTTLLTPLARIGSLLQETDLGLWASRMEESAAREYESLMAEKLTVSTEAQLREELCSLLERELEIAREDCRVTLETATDGDGLQLTRVWIALRGAAALTDPRRIEALIGETVGCPCTVSLG